MTREEAQKQIIENDCAYNCRLKYPYCARRSCRWYVALEALEQAAYDVEAVVKELEQEKFVAYLKDDVAAIEHNLTLNKAIAIVKRGGRDE